MAKVYENMLDEIKDTLTAVKEKNAFPDSALYIKHVDYLLEGYVAPEPELALEPAPEPEPEPEPAPEEE